MKLFVFPTSVYVIHMGTFSPGNGTLDANHHQIGHAQKSSVLMLFFYHGVCARQFKLFLKGDNAVLARGAVLMMIAIFLEAWV